MRAVVDTNYFIYKLLSEEDISHVYITQSVDREIKDRMSRDYLELYGFKVEIRDPKEEYVKIVREMTAGKHFGISDTDIDVVALALELSEEAISQWQGPGLEDKKEVIRCLSRDNGIRAAIQLLGIGMDESFESRRYRMRCYTCLTMYDEAVDFCRNCGYATITRVTVVGEGENERVMLKKGYVPRERILRDSRGKEIKSAGQREYSQYQIEKKQNSKLNKDLFL